MYWQKVYRQITSAPSIFILGICSYTLVQANIPLPTDTPAIRSEQVQVAQRIAPYATDIQMMAQHAYQNAKSPAIQAQLSQLHGFNNVPASVQNPEIATPGDVLIFVSLSMPEMSLKQWFVQAQRLKAPLIVRGLVNDSFSQTQAKIAALSTESKGGVVLEPRLFADYQITEVPAVVVRNTVIACAPTQNCPHAYPFDVVAGDVSLDAALSAVANQEDGSAREPARAALQLYRGRP